MELPSLTTLRHILDRLKANDISWFKDQWTSGSFGWMKDKLPSGEYEQIGSRVEAGDLNPLKGALGKMDLPGIDLFKGLAGNVTGAAGAAAGAAGAAAGAAAGIATGVASGAAAAGAGKIAGAAKVGTNTAKAAVTNTTKTVVDEESKKKGFLWVIPALIGVAALAFGLSRCGGSKKAVVADTVVAGETTVVAGETTVAAVAPETTVAAVTAETTVATKAADTTVAAKAADTTAAVAAPAAGTDNILATAAAAGKFNTLAAAVKTAGLEETLNGAGPFTVFAPTDDAFAKLPAGLVDTLLKPENKETLTKILTYHVVPGTVTAADLKAGAVKSVEGSDLTVVTEGGVMIDKAKVITADVAAKNGVIHIIDSVLVPADVDVAKLLAGAAAPAADTTIAAKAADTTVAAAAAPASAPENLTVYFANASARINKEAQAKIDGAVTQLKDLPAGTTVFIVGHASKTGNSATNEKLSLARANNVKDALTAGLGESKASNISFKVEFRGDSQPDEDAAKSRKVTIEIQPKK
jgi:uncharacterized surface protein with fasciclin (FAS1) repeats